MLVHCNQEAGNIAYGDNSGSNSGSDSDLAIKSNPNGKYKCLFCSKNYSTEEILGEHFLRKHNEFDTMGKLDTKSHIVGFPGSDILEHIGMIETYFTKLSFDYFIRKQFQEQNEQNIDTPNVATSVPNSEPIKCIMCDEQYNIEIIEDNKSAGKSELVRPIIMKCCKKSICETCLQSHLNNTKSCSCPFCRKDHTRYDLDYIKIDTVNNVIYIGKSDNSSSIVIQGNLTYPNSVSNWYPTPNEYGYIDQSNSNAYVNQFNSNFTNNYVNQFSW
jgi:hypothetical protein